MKPVYMIAEAGVAHEGEPTSALSLLDAAVKAGADAFKIQYYCKGFDNGVRELPFLQEHVILRLKELCDINRIDFIVTPHDRWAIDFLEHHNLCETYKVGHGDWDLLPVLVETKKPLIISWVNGLITERLMRLCRQVDYKLLYCTDKYPTQLWEIDYNAIVGNSFDGFSDHTEGDIVSFIAVLGGADIIEKHICLEKNVEGRRDTTFAFLPDELKEFVESIRILQNVRTTIKI